MVHDPCDLENNVQSFVRIFDRKDAEGDCFIIQGIEDCDILVQVWFLRSDPFLFKFFNCQPIDDHLLPRPFKDNPCNDILSTCLQVSFLSFFRSARST